MRVLRGIEEVPERGPATVVVLGNFDGVHRGHQALLELGVERAEAISAEPWALTFDPHPSTVLGPHLAPPLLCTLERRLELIAAQGIVATAVLRFDDALAATSCESFVERYLEPTCARELVVGYDFTFGRGRTGDAGVLQDIGGRHGMTVRVVSPVSIEGGIVPSSTKVRQLLLEGRVEAAATLLGRPHEVGGLVVPGEGRGAALGFPTANVEVEGGVLLPANGVYAARARLATRKDSPGLQREADAPASPRGERWWAAAANIGTNPTFTSATKVLFEIHLLDYDGPSLVGSRLRVQIASRLRGERRFPSASALVEQIDRDVAETRKVLNEHDG